jgi:tetratricopeptide (TPR) repeat protein
MEQNNGTTKSGITLARNPLGIISLFVFFIEAIATVSLKIAVDTAYVGHVVWFIILFPTLIIVLFFITLWAKRESFYSPMEFRDDQSFLALLTKVDHLEAKQVAAELDPVTADLSEVFATIDRLLALNDLRSAIEVGRAYLKQEQYDESTEVFSYLQKKASRRDEAYYKILSNLGYSLVGKGMYKEAIDCLSEVEQISGGAEFRAWHSLAMAYSYFKLGEFSLYRKWLDEAKKRPEFKRLNVPFFKSLYPEISHDLEVG